MRRRARATQIVDGRLSYRLPDDEREDKKLVATGFFSAHPANADIYEPRPTQLVPKAGAWAMITRQLPPLEGDLDDKIRVGRVFWIEHTANADDDGFTPDGTYKVKCRSPFGDVVLWPYEYTVVRPDFLTDVWARGEYVFYPLGASEEQFSDILFYCLSRGIARADAVVMALGTMSGPVGWFEPCSTLMLEIEEFAADVGNVGGPLTEKNHARRRAAQARRSNV